MLKLKDIKIVESKKELEALPEGKLLINTINAHSYNTALKDAFFAEALMKGGCTDSRRSKHRDGLPETESEKPADRTYCRMGLVYHGDGTAEPEGRYLLLHGK